MKWEHEKKGRKEGQSPERERDNRERDRDGDRFLFHFPTSGSNSSMCRAECHPPLSQRSAQLIRIYLKPEQWHCRLAQLSQCFPAPHMGVA